MEPAPDKGVLANLTPVASVSFFTIEDSYLVPLAYAGFPKINSPEQ